MMSERKDAFEEKKDPWEGCSLYGGAEGGGYRKKLLADQPFWQKKIVITFDRGLFSGVRDLGQW